MTAYMVRRLLLFVPGIFLATILVSLVVRLLPGSIIDVMMAEAAAFDVKDRAVLEAKLGLDKSWPEQYARWMGGVVKGDLGKSLRTGRPIAKELRNRLPTSLEMAAMALAFAVVIAVPIGIIAAVKQNSIWDYVGRSFAIGAMAVPGFWLATLVVVWPTLWWGWAPPLQYKRFWEDPLANLDYLWLPALLLSLYVAGVVMRMTRSMMLEVMREDYVRTARAKGLRERAVIWRHALKNALIPVITTLGIYVPFLIGGAVVFEHIFAVPGVGRFLLDAAANRDYPVLQAVVLVMSLVVMVTNLVIDLSYAYLDPRIRFG